MQWKLEISYLFCFAHRNHPTEWILYSRGASDAALATLFVGFAHSIRVSVCIFSNQKQMNNGILIKIEIILTLNRFEHWTLCTILYTQPMQIANKDGTSANDNVVNFMWNVNEKTL